MKNINLIEKLKELGFELKEDYYDGLAYVYRTPREPNLRFVHDFAYYPDENQFYINCHKTRWTETISEKELLQDHNECNTPAKDQWLLIKENLKDYEFSVYLGI